MIASFGEIKFVLSGFMFQMGGLCFEAYRLALVQRLLSSEESKMDPMVSLYYYSPVCASIIFILALFVELPKLTIQDLHHVGLWTLAANAAIAFLLNVSSVLLVCPCPVSSLNHIAYHENADRENFFLGPYALRCPQEYYHRACIYSGLEDSGDSDASSGIHGRNNWFAILFVWRSFYSRLCQRLCSSKQPERRESYRSKAPYTAYHCEHASDDSSPSRSYRRSACRLQSGDGSSSILVLDDPAFSLEVIFMVTQLKVFMVAMSVDPSAYLYVWHCTCRLLPLTAGV